MVAKKKIVQGCVRVCRLWMLGLILTIFCSAGLYAQKDDEIVKALVNAGFENVSRVISDTEEIITFENSVWKADGEGIREAINVIEKYPFIAGKTRRVIVLQLGLPQISLVLPPSAPVAVPGTTNSGWLSTYGLGDVWKAVKNTPRINRSRWKVDLVFYPQFAFRNQKYRRIYDVLLNLSPALEIAPMRGMKITGQVIIPVFNQYGAKYEQIRPGFFTLEQHFRVLNNFVDLTAGIFNQDRWGLDLRLSRPVMTEGWLSNFAVEGRIGLTGSSYFYHWNWHYGPAKLITWNVGGSYFNPMFNVLCEVKAIKFLAGDYGVRADMTRHFKRASVGFYIMKNNRGNVDGGFHFAIALPPMRQKRGKYFRVMPARYFDLEYKAAGLFFNGKSYETRPGENKAINNFNPKYIKSQLKN